MLKKNTQVFLPSFEIHVIKLHRLLRLSQQAETRKAGKKASFPGRREPGRRWEDLSLWQISPLFHLVLGLAVETQGGKITFETGSN